MPSLIEALREDPSATFDLRCDLPSGNTMVGSVGPMINGRIAANISFVGHPSDEDIQISTDIMNQAMGMPPEVTITSRTPEEKAKALQTVRAFFGGGQG